MSRRVADLHCCRCGSNLYCFEGGLFVHLREFVIRHCILGRRELAGSWGYLDAFAIKMITGFLVVPMCVAALFKFTVWARMWAQCTEGDVHTIVTKEYTASDEEARTTNGSPVIRLLIQLLIASTGC